MYENVIPLLTEQMLKIRSALLLWKKYKFVLEMHPQKKKKYTQTSSLKNYEMETNILSTP